MPTVKCGGASELRWVQVSPLCMALTAILLFASVNAGQIEPTAAVMPLLVAGAATTAAVGLLRIFLRPVQSAVYGSLLVIVFFGHGQLIDLPIWGLENYQYRHMLLLALEAGLLLTVILALRGNAPRAATAARFARNTALILLLWSTLQFAWVFGRSGPSAEDAIADVLPPAAGLNQGRDPTELPDIYYIVLDGHARHDVLRDLLGCPDDGLAEDLRSRGFYVAERSHSNYARTFLSLSSSLNMRYVNAEGESLGPDSKDRTPYYQLVWNHNVGRYLKAQGYKYVLLRTYWTGTERSRIADEVYPSTPLTEFTQVLIGTTLLGPALNRVLIHISDHPSAAGNPYAALTLAQFDKLKEIPLDDSPTFTFAHIICPHSPYVFDRFGNVRCDVTDHMNTNREAYLEQVQYLRKVVPEVIDSILARSKRKPIIIVQSDHGSATQRFSPEIVDERRRFVQERFSNLNAFLVPDSCRANLYPEISPVNNFRVLLNDLFHAGLPLLPDRQYFCWGDNLYRFEDVTQWLSKPEATARAAGDRL